jgi:hypothetical protein
MELGAFMKKDPKILAAVAVAILLAIIGGIFVMRSKADPEPETTTERPKKKKITEPVNIIEVSERPYVYLTPQADGRNIKITVATISKPADTFEYELEYQAGTLLQGAFDQVELDNIPTSTQILFGSCSAGGACTYHTDIRGGSLVLRFIGEENYALKQDWRYFDNWGNKETQFASKDSKFQLTSADLAKQRFVVVYNSPCFPEGVTGTSVSEAYSLAASSNMSGTAEVTMRANEEGELSIIGYDGTSWTSFETTSDGKSATAEVELMELYMVIK